MGQPERDHKNNEQDVFEEPGLSIERMNRGDNPSEATDCSQGRDEFLWVQ